MTGAAVEGTLNVSKEALQTPIQIQKNIVDTTNIHIELGKLQANSFSTLADHKLNVSNSIYNSGIAIETVLGLVMENRASLVNAELSSLALNLRGRTSAYIGNIDQNMFDIISIPENRFIASEHAQIFRLSNTVTKELIEFQVQEFLRLQNKYDELGFVYQQDKLNLILKTGERDGLSNTFAEYFRSNSKDSAIMLSRNIMLQYDFLAVRDNKKLTSAQKIKAKLTKVSKRLLFAFQVKDFVDNNMNKEGSTENLMNLALTQRLQSPNFFSNSELITHSGNLREGVLLNQESTAALFKLNQIVDAALIRDSFNAAELEL
jgi:hypothetical protein